MFGVASHLRAAEASGSLQLGAWGFDMAGQERSVDPGDDFFVHANGRFLRTLAIPPDRSRYGIADILESQTEARLLELLATADSRGHSVSSGVPQAKALFRSFMDEDSVEKLGARPLERELSALRAINSHADLARFLAGPGTFRQVPFKASIEINLRTPDRYALVLRQGGLGLPNRDFYLRANATERIAYESYAARMLALCGWGANASRDAAATVVRLETQIARVSLPADQVREFDRNYHQMTVAELD